MRRLAAGLIMLLVFCCSTTMNGAEWQPMQVDTYLQRANALILSLADVLQLELEPWYPVLVPSQQNVAAYEAVGDFGEYQAKLEVYANGGVARLVLYVPGEENNNQVLAQLLAALFALGNEPDMRHQLSPNALTEAGQLAALLTKWRHMTRGYYLIIVDEPDPERAGIWYVITYRLEPPAAHDGMFSLEELNAAIAALAGTGLEE